jgi:hypothetical protein
MKNFVFLSYVLFFGFSTSLFAQYSSKELKKLEKMEIRIVNRGLDLDATFVPYCEPDGTTDLHKTSEENWSKSMFVAGLEVGDYSGQSVVKDSNNREMNLSRTNTFNGRYVFDVSTSGLVKISDLFNNNKVVATISYKSDLNYAAFGADVSFKREYLISKLIESNKK